MEDKIREAKRTQIKAFTAVAVLTAIICLPITCAQSSLAQQQQDGSGSNSNSSQTVNLQNMTSQQQPRSFNETEFVTYISPELGIQIDHPTDWSPIIREYADNVRVLEFNASRPQ